MILQFQGKLVGVPDVDNAVIGVNEPTPPPPPTQFPWNTFTDIGTIYQSLGQNDQVAFVIRHTERNEQGEVTEAGIEYALHAGSKLSNGIASQTDIALYSSNKQRCITTAEKIAEGSGRSGTPTLIEYISSCPYEEIAPSSGWEDYSLFAYDLPSIHGGVFYPKTTITPQILDLVKNNMTKKLNIFVTHDQLLEIFVTDMCNKEISLRFWDGAINDGVNEKRWITYLAGLAIIRRGNESYEWCPVKSLDRGFQRGYDWRYVPG
jgi:hypothetical protein